MPVLGVILAGGSGTRLWPMSRELYPKQFLSLQGSRSLLRSTAELATEQLEEVVVATHREHFFYVRDELQDIVPEDNIILEPFRRNPAPAIALASLFISENFGDKNFLVMPSDHVLGREFFELVPRAEPLAERYLVAFGVKPGHPATGYGYIKPGRELEAGYEVERFIEKPSRERAAELIEEGCLWNAGIFLFSIPVLSEELGRHAPEIAEHMGSFDEMLRNYRNLPSISIDYALMERSSRCAVVPYSGRWRDVGNWKSVYEIMEKDESRNATRGEVVLRDTERCLVYGDDRLIACLGVENLAIVDTRDALLVSNLERVEDVRGVVETLIKEGRREARIHTTVHRPWGYYTLLEEGERYKVKRLCIHPGKRISLQRHHHRAEHWIVVRGTARVLREVNGRQEEVFVHENESIYIPKSVKHRLENPGKV
ncbi:MAG: mannose-1-phosphate guanylyltransferase/mannose-6-phosphate isomerase, partial [Euryarchaeota archaeon]|nr:mannose-1-phosphate guanylyltransferase/mannose-6-phosphate isomerase [Euryarchaeota archaeon]